MLCSLLHGSAFEYFVTTSRRDQYNLMWLIEAHERAHKSVNDQSISGDGRPLSSNSTKHDLISFGITLNFIEIWLQSFNANFLCRKTMYCEEIHHLVKKIPDTLMELDNYIKKIQLVLTDTGE